MATEECKRPYQWCIDVGGGFGLSEIWPIVWILVFVIWPSNDCPHQKIWVGIFVEKELGATLACYVFGILCNRG